jgi:hypothetical protein
LVAAFLSGFRAATANYEDHGWTRLDAEQQNELCTRTEQLGPRGAFLVVKLCCGGAKVDVQTALETVEAIQSPAP